MIVTKENISNMIDSPSRKVNARVELYEGSTLLKIFKYSDALKSVTVDRVGQQGKFFGFGVVQKLTVELMDRNREINLTDKNTFELEYGAGFDYVYTYPFFKVAEVKRDENTNDLTVTAYDILNDTSSHYVNELEMPDSYTIKDFARACGKLFGLGVNIEGVTDGCFDLYFETGANFEGTETIRKALDAIAEATQTIYYINSQWVLTFKRLNKNDEAVYTIDKSKYFTLQSKEEKTLATICSATELGDNVSNTKTYKYVPKNIFKKNQKVTHIQDIAASFSVTDTGESILYTAQGNAGNSSYQWDSGQLMFPNVTAKSIETDGIQLEATDYVISFNYELLQVGIHSENIALLVYDENLGLKMQVYAITQGACQVPFKAPAACKYALCFRINNNYVRISDIQIEKGTEQTAYEYPFEAYEVVVEGVTQYVRDNPFWELREDVGTLVENAVNNVSEMSIAQINCDARGNFLLEIGDKIDFVTKDDKTVTSYLLNDTLTYNGGMSQNISWEYTENETETESNPSTLGEKLQQTFARVDKASKQIEILTSETDANSEKISTLEMNTESINASVGVINSEIDAISKKVDLSVTADDVSIAIQRERENGANKVETETGFVFNDVGLTITKTNSEISTQITEDGMTVSKGNNEVLTADNKGVKAIDLHAETYLIVGKNSRFEDFENNRTGCFWIGG